MAKRPPKSQKEKLTGWETVLKYKKWRNRKISSSSTCMERKTAMDHKPVLLKQASNKLGKYPYNKKQRMHYKF